MRRHKYLHVLIGLLLAGLGLYLFFRKAGDGDEAVLDTLVREIAGTSIIAVIICVVLTILPMWLRAVRLGIMLPDGLPPRNKRGLFAVCSISYMINNILPARVGEAARVFLLWRRNGYPVTVSVGALLLERALDIIVYLAFLFVPVLAIPSITESFHGVKGMHEGMMLVTWLSAAAFAVLVGLFLLYALRPGIFRSALGRLSKLLPVRFRAWAGKIGAELESSLGWIFSPRKAAAVVVLTVVTALCYAMMLPVLISDWSAFGPFEAVFGQAFAAFGAAIPLAPGGVGTLHAALLFGLASMGVDPGKARAVVVLYHGIQYVVITLLGLFMLLGAGVRFKDITEKSAP